MSCAVEGVLYWRRRFFVCDGGGGALGHPRVYLTLVEGKIECGYCGRMYVLKPGFKALDIH